ncbi:hypothetical protein [Halorubrum saccharovorum]|uniref:hypothetical protein n=1 Tax=Halorubrum saccharovorum TaxID=2248 RepID=UPI00128E1C8A|nr:hypothetical protein [Halorubrum saccharovorum]
MTRVAPGAVIVITFVVTVIPVPFDGISISPTYLIAGIFVFSFIIGEYLNLLREVVFPVPASFRRILYTETENDKYLRNYDRLMMQLEKWPYIPKYDPKKYSIYVNSDQNFWETLQNELNTSESQSARDIFQIFSLYMETRIGRATRRKQILYEFNENLIFASIISTMLIIYGFIIPGVANPAIAIVLLPFYIIIFVTLLIPPFRIVEHIFVDVLIAQFYTEKGE